MTSHFLEGCTIKRVRPMTPQEMQEEMWDEPAVVLELDDGALLYPSQDTEGNGPGTLFGKASDGRTIYILPEQGT